ncbi:oligosaccharide flippase family protein [Lacinutrix jangbogonensis]|uniref:oligosaccharide flippase family protein n=1 Tax=Lacinutrix jangbogonensis TaxID=1469557 RepID=UPI00053D6B44|nr:oligosaccharide flippase family protein [Lacinutrix jangbogonensis]
MINKIKTKLEDTDIKDLIFKGGAFFFIKIAGVLFSFLFTWVVAKWYGANVNGLIAISFSIMMIGAIAPKLGYDLNLVRYLSIGNANKRLFNQATLISLFLSFIIMIILLMLRERLALIFFDKVVHLEYINYACYSIPIVVYISLGTSVFRVEKQNSKFSFYTNTSRFLFAIIILSILTFVFNVKEDSFPIKAYFFALLITAILIAFQVRPILNSKFKDSRKIKIKNFTIDSLPMMFSASIVVIMGWADSIILGLYEKESVVGVYSVVVKISTLISFGLNSLNSILAPQLANLYAQGNTIKYSKLIKLVSKINFFCSLVTILFLIVFNDYILSFFGDEFIEGQFILIVLCVGQFVNAFCGPVGVVLQMTGNQKVFKNFLFIALIINIILNLLLIPKMGMLGGALGTIFALAFWNISSAVYIYNKLKIKSFYIPFKL